MDSLTSRNSPTSSPREQKKRKEVKLPTPLYLQSQKNEDFKAKHCTSFHSKASPISTALRFHLGWCNIGSLNKQKKQSYFWRTLSREACL
uniref:Heavy meromyosin chain E n=1 Tax=Dolomedes sulfureus TaxID=492288 RepID=A0A0P0DQG2_9ARAC|nr:heavy meromyosin chain E [Dolomedes sulfureus]